MKVTLAVLAKPRTFTQLLTVQGCVLFFNQTIPVLQLATVGYKYSNPTELY